MGVQEVSLGDPDQQRHRHEVVGVGEQVQGADQHLTATLDEKRNILSDTLTGRKGSPKKVVEDGLARSTKFLMHDFGSLETYTTFLILEARI